MQPLSHSSSHCSCSCSSWINSWPKRRGREESKGALTSGDPVSVPFSSSLLLSDVTSHPHDHEVLLCSAATSFSLHREPNFPFLKRDVDGDDDDDRVSSAETVIRHKTLIPFGHCYLLSLIPSWATSWCWWLSCWWYFERSASLTDSPRKIFD